MKKEKNNRFMMISHEGEGFNIHYFSFDKKDIKEKKEIVCDDLDAGKFYPAGVYEKPPIAGYSKRYIGERNEREKIMKYVICPLCGAEVIIESKLGKIVGTRLVEDCRVI